MTHHSKPIENTGVGGRYLCHSTFCISRY